MEEAMQRQIRLLQSHPGCKDHERKKAADFDFICCFAKHFLLSTPSGVARTWRPRLGPT
jgi:hypothetical protein